MTAKRILKITKNCMGFSIGLGSQPNCMRRFALLDRVQTKKINLKNVMSLADKPTPKPTI